MKKTIKYEKCQIRQNNNTKIYQYIKFINNRILHFLKNSIVKEQIINHVNFREENPT